MFYSSVLFFTYLNSVWICDNGEELLAIIMINKSCLPITKGEELVHVEVFRRHICQMGIDS